MTRVLVTGVRGKTGTPLARLLVARGVEVLGGSSAPGDPGLDGVRPTAFSWDDPDGWAPALDDVDAVYVVRPDRADAPELVAALLERARTGTRVVLLSEQDAGYEGPGGWAPRVEQAVLDSGHDWTLLRPSWFMQVFTDRRFYRDGLLESGDLPFADGGRPVAWVDARDIAAVAERALLEDGHAGVVHEITGPEALGLPRTAELLSQALGRTVTHRETTVEEELVGLTGFERDLTALTFERVRAGSFSVVTDTVERVTGRPAQTLAAFLADSDLRP